MMRTDRLALRTIQRSASANGGSEHWMKRAPGMIVSERTQTQIETTGIDPALKAPMYGLLIWIAGCILWNMAGVALVWLGAPSIGPTASLRVAIVLGLAAILLVYTARHNLILFAILCALFAFSGFAAVYQAVTEDPSLWPSPFWRWAGAALNAFGLAASTIGTARGLLSRKYLARNHEV